ncbi:hypothetical protein CROQUDRAFT_13567, partial [Cronartium quercuum f. sp. fusiforme G11]
FTDTEIDWRAYMQEVEGYLHGERDYTKIRGDTGPLVYPAGFVYLYSWLYHLTDKGSNLKLAQYVFAVVYLMTMAVVFAIFKRCRSIPPYALVFLVLSKRLHSIYTLRLFNDGLTMLGFYTSLWCLVHKRWNWSAIWFSLALSIKMNILLFFPAFGLIWFQSVGFLRTLWLLIIIVGIQALLAGPFLLAHPVSYLSKAFEFDRVFFYKWTVNWHMLSESNFLSRGFSTALTVAHTSLLGLFAWTRWCRAYGEKGPIRLVLNGLFNYDRPACKRASEITPDYVVKVCFTCNLIGIVCARTLHYQFYCWYAHQIVYLAWQTAYPLWMRVLMMVTIELCWNVYPANALSSSALFLAHLALLVGVWFSD